MNAPWIFTSADEAKLGVHSLYRGFAFANYDRVTLPSYFGKAAADSLVQTLAPFLIVASERVFLQYAWFYQAQDGNFPCPAGIECGNAAGTASCLISGNVKP